jgi:uncharacterized protein (DUF2461 family)
MKKTKQNRLSLQELEALIRRVEARSLQQGDGQIIKAVIEKTFALRELVKNNKIPSRPKLRRLLAIPRPESPDE